MASITTRSGKGSALTHVELDNNFTNLNTDKLEVSTASSTYLAKAGGTMSGNLTFAAGQPTATISSPNIVQLTDATNSISTTTAATPNSVKLTYDIADAAIPKAGGTFTGNVNLNVNNGNVAFRVLQQGSGDALVVTQSGTGNALLVEDEDSDLSPFVIKNDGKVGIGVATPSEALHAVGKIRAEAAATQDAVVLQGRSGGANSRAVTITPASLSASRTLTLADGDTTLQGGTMATTEGKLSQFAATSSSELAGVISDETGSGSLVFATSPSLTTPSIGAATGTSLTLTGGGLTARPASTQDAVIIAGRSGGASSYAVTVTPTTLTASRTLTLADGDTTLVAGTMVPTSQVATTSSAGIVQLTDSASSNSSTTAATPSAVNAVKTAFDALDAALVGAVMAFAANAAPSGWVKCNGAAVNRTGTYARLWAFAQASGNLAATEGAKQSGQFGPGNGTSTFTLPDLRGEFLRGWADDRAVDTGRSIGTAQADDYKQHSHTITDNGHSHGFRGKSNDNVSRTNPAAIVDLNHTGANGTLRDPADSGTGVQSGTTGITGTNASPTSGGAETRPRNVALLYCIKY